MADCHNFGAGKAVALVVPQPWHCHGSCTCSGVPLTRNYAECAGLPLCNSPTHDPPEAAAAMTQLTLPCLSLHLQQYILANAAVSRSFSAYFAALIGKETSFFTFPYQEYTVDFLAAGLMVACGLLLMFSTAGGSLFNAGRPDDCCCNLQ